MEQFGHVFCGLAIDATAKMTGQADNNLYTKKPIKLLMLLPT